MISINVLAHIKGQWVGQRMSLRMLPTIAFSFYVHIHHVVTTQTFRRKRS